MTALIGILNKRAAVIAADSAVTISRGDNRTIINTAKKLFRNAVARREKSGSIM